MNKITFMLTTIFVLFRGIAPSFGQTISEEAKMHFNRGMAAVETATSKEDYLAAINEFKQAINLAPDWADVYYNLGLVQDKAGNYDEAINNLKKYLNLLPNAKDVTQVRETLDKLEYKRDRSNIEGIL